jgi:HD-GYP domain-containing protein (c-di-GMP phosphodiesterase class II)
MTFTSDLQDFAQMLSCAVDLMERGTYHHGQKVAYIAKGIYEHLMAKEAPANLIITSSIHDIGISSFEDKERARQFFANKQILRSHCVDGASLVESVDILKPLKPIILHHHTNYSDIDKYEEGIPIEAQIIHLADRVDVLINPERYILDQVDDIVDVVLKYRGTMFNPELVDAFLDLSVKESFWLDLTNEYQHAYEHIVFPSVNMKMDMEDIYQFSYLCAKIVDRKSPYTAEHSQRIAGIATALGELCDMDEQDVYFLELAGLLHDLGKLAVPEHILLKNGKLSEAEYRIVKQHPYYTYCLIDRLKIMNKVRDWAGFHHERLDGSGYPFHLKGDQLDLGARVMAVADIVGAITEDRPYRPGFEKRETLKILWEQVDKNLIDGDVVSILAKHFDDVIYSGIKSKVVV